MRYSCLVLCKTEVLKQGLTYGDIFHIPDRIHQNKLLGNWEIYFCRNEWTRQIQTWGQASMKGVERENITTKSNCKHE